MRRLIQGVIAMVAVAGLAHGQEAPPAASACAANENNPCIIELHGAGAPAASESCTSEAWRRNLRFTIPGRFANEDADDWHEVVVELDLDPAKGCRNAHFSVELGAPVTGPMLNIGDSPTNNGGGGDQFTTGNAAELDIPNGRTLQVFSGVSSIGLPTAIGVEQLLTADLGPLEGRSLQVEVGDQFLKVVRLGVDGEGPVTFELKMPQGQRLFALAGQEKRIVLGQGQVADYRIFAAFNRVIHHRDGNADKGRRGTGVRRVALYLTR